MAESEAVDAPEQIEPRWFDYAVPGALAVIMWVAWLSFVFRGENMLAWAISAQALRQGHIAAIGLHMFAHGGLFHVLMNTVVLVEIGAIVVARLGNPPASFTRFLALFFGSGLAGMVAYLIVHPFGNVPMLGASGAIYGLVGMLVRSPYGAAPIGLQSAEMRQAAIEFIKGNALWFALLTVPLLLQGKSGGLAWEAHLGGFLFGIMVGHRFLDRSSSVRDD